LKHLNTTEGQKDQTENRGAMHIGFREVAEILGPVQGARVGRQARPSPREPIEAQAKQVMPGKPHEIAVVGGWRGGGVGGVCVHGPKANLRRCPHYPDGRPVAQGLANAGDCAPQPL
jgi:hypothetical protein